MAHSPKGAPHSARIDQEAEDGRDGVPGMRRVQPLDDRPGMPPPDLVDHGVAAGLVGRRPRPAAQGWSHTYIGLEPPGRVRAPPGRVRAVCGGSPRAADRVATLNGVVQQVTETRTPKPPRWVRRGLLTLAAAVTFLGVVLVVAAWTEDISIDSDIGYAPAEVVSVNFTRTLVRFYTSDGAERIPQTGVLYPADLKVGDIVQVEYSQSNPELVRVAGRGAIVMLLPVGLTVLGVWAVVVPAVWWLRRRM